MVESSQRIVDTFPLSTPVLLCLSFLKPLKLSIKSSDTIATSKQPRNAVYKDSIVAYLALKSHFAISDNYQSDESLNEIGTLM